MYTGAGNFSSHLQGSSSATALGNPYPFLHHTQLVDRPIMIPMPPPPYSGIDHDEFPRRDERWSDQETRDFIQIRAHLEWEFTTAKRNRNLWEMVANRMRDKGYPRTADQCKFKWKNLVSRYKGQEASDVDGVRACPFFNELHEMFRVRANRMQHTQSNTEMDVVKGRERYKSVSEDQSHKDFTEDGDDEEEIVMYQGEKGKAVPKQKVGREKRRKMCEKENDLMVSDTNVSKNESFVKSVGEMMRSFIVQQEMMDMRWRESIEKHAGEREAFEQEWQQKMEKLEREKLMMEQAWREREEQRREREESRAEKRDALLTTLLNKLIHECDES